MDEDLAGHPGGSPAAPLPGEFATPEISELLRLWLQRTSDYAVLLLDARGTIRAWLGAASFMLGFDAGEAVGRPVSFIFTAEDRAQALDVHELEVADRNGHSEDERWHVRKDGTRIWVTGTVTAIRWPDGSLRAFAKVMRDRTDLRSQLERLDAQGRELAGGRERTHAYLRTLGHEIRNSLAPLHNAVHIVHRTAQDPRSASAMRMAEKQLEVLGRLADDLVDVVRLESGKIRLALQRMDLCQVLASCVQSLHRSASERGVLLEAILPEAPLWVHIDPARFQQIVLNLVSNGIKYNRPAGKVSIMASREGAEVVFRVEDSGMGIPPELLPRIFDLFARAPAAELAAPGGLGVGLSLVRQLVELHGGTVQARSAGTGKGAQFSVRLPAA